MTDSASQSLVERLPELPDDHSDLTPELALMVVGKYRELMSQQAARITELEAERDRLQKYCSAAASDYGNLLTTLESSIGPPFLESFKETRNELRESSEFMRLAAEGRENGLLYDDELCISKKRADAAESDLARVRDELDASNNNHRAMAHQMAELGARCKHAESELSRVEVETIERCANFLAREYPDNANTNAFCAAIRSVPPLAKRGERESPSKQTQRERE